MLVCYVLGYNIILVCQRMRTLVLDVVIVPENFRYTYMF